MVVRRLFSEPRFRIRTVRICSVSMLALGLLASALGVINDGWPGLLNGLLAIVVSLVILFVLVPLDLRQQARAEKKPDDQ